MNNQIRVLIADANEGFTAQLSGFLGENPAFVVAGARFRNAESIGVQRTCCALRVESLFYGGILFARSR